MKRNKLKALIGVCCLIVSLFSNGQDRDVVFKGDFDALSFDLFVSDVESKTGAYFYYLSEWTDSIYITAKGDSLSLCKILDDSFKGKNLYYYIDDDLSVYITFNKPLKTALNTKYSNSNLPDVSSDDIVKTDLTESERNYMEGRRTKNLETKIIGVKGTKTDNKPVVLTGWLKSKENGEPLIGATIYIEEFKKGYASDLNGRFKISLLPGKYHFVFNNIGMEEESYLLDIYSDGSLVVEMTSTLIALDEVMIVSDRFHNVKSTQMGFEHLNIKTIKEIPVVLGERDLIKAAQLLPGVQNMGEGSSGFYVRGSSADQNMFIINNIPIYNTSHMFGFFSAFNPDIVSEFTLYKSNIPAKYGGRLSSVFDIKSPRGNNKKYTLKGGISPVTGHMSFEGPIVKDKGSFIISGRSTYSDWIMSRVKNADLRDSQVAFYDIGGNFYYAIDGKNELKSFLYYSHDQFSLTSYSHYKYSNTGASLSWQHQFKPEFTSENSLVYSGYNFWNVDSLNSGYGSKQEYDLQHIGFISDYQLKLNDNHLLGFGVNNVVYLLNRGSILPSSVYSELSPIYLGKEKGNETAIYVSDEYTINTRLTLSLGLRYSVYSYLGPQTTYTYDQNLPREASYIIDTLYYSNNKAVKYYSGPEIRGGLNYRIGESSSIKLSYNRNRQYLFMLSNTIAISPADKWKLCDNHIIPPISDQYSIGYYKNYLNDKISFSTELYYKDVKNYIEYKDGADLVSSTLIETELLQGDQNAYGFELMLKKNYGKLTGWISYCYSKSEILVTGPNSWDKINEGIKYPSNYDKPHSFNSVVNFRVSRQIGLCATMVYSTGRPITYPNGIYYIDNTQQVVYSSRNSSRIPDYFRTDISITIDGNLKAKKLAHSSWMINVYNLTGRENAYSVFFRSENRKMECYKMSIFSIPVFTISWNFKLGNYASE